MGFVAHRNLPFGPGVIPKLLDLVKEEIVQEGDVVAKEYVKFGRRWTPVYRSMCIASRPRGVSARPGWIENLCKPKN